MGTRQAVPPSEAEWLPVPLRRLRAQLLILVPIATIVAVAMAWGEHGIFWPDEFYQITEPAHRWVFGYGFRAWEFQEGLRSWILPGVMGVVWAIVDRLGVDSGLGFMRLARLLVALGGVGAVAAAITWAHRTRGSLAGLLAGVMLIITPFALLMNLHTFGETVAAALIMVAALAVPGGVAAAPHPRLVTLCGIAAGFAIPIRPQSVLLVGGFVVMLLVEGRRDTARRFAVPIGAVIMLSGLIDWITWGVPFASFWRNFQFQLIEGGASKYFGSHPFTFFAVHLPQTYGVFGVIVVMGLIAAAWVIPKHVINVVAFVFVHSLIAHKELRFVYPVIPYATAVSAVGLSYLAQRIHLSVAPPPEPVRPSAKGTKKGGKRDAAAEPSAAPPRSTTAPLAIVGVVITLFAVLGVVQARSLTFGDAGNTVFWDADASVWNNSAGWNQLLSVAGQRTETCGVAIGSSNRGEGTILTGGFGYLHRDVPLYSVDVAVIAAAPPELRTVNVILMAEGIEPPPEYTMAATDQGVAMLVRDGACDPVPREYTTDFPRPGDY
ncbi:MAG: hypothetical protein ACOYL9_15030 [Ilumatobacteraceae bacterium]